MNCLMEPQPLHRRINRLVVLVLVMVSISGCSGGSAVKSEPIASPTTAQIEPTQTLIQETEPAPTATAQVEPAATELTYTTRSGDSLSVILLRFNVNQDEVKILNARDGQVLEQHETGFLPEGTPLSFPDHLAETYGVEGYFPDSELVYSPAVSGFNSSLFLTGTGGYLSTYSFDRLKSMPVSAGELIDKVAIENSINPRVLLAFAEYKSGLVYGSLADDSETDYLLGIEDWRYEGLYGQLIWIVEQLTTGYYGWRSGDIDLFIHQQDFRALYPPPDMNAGTAAMVYLFDHLPKGEDAQVSLEEFLFLYQQMFGDWEEVSMFPTDFAQPDLILPFLPGHTWAFTSGPHSAWEENGALAALDFSPSSLEVSCEPAGEWVTAVADGVVVRKSPGVLVVDLDGDGDESTGWVILYVHLEEADTYALGDQIFQEQLIGHPSCLGGPATSTHLHIARKYNGEWMLAGGAIPFTMDGFVTLAGDEPYLGAMQKDGIITPSNLANISSAYIKRPRSVEDQ
ncbi:MAG: hypothetical protein JXA19_02025 [Anaerolineales bacterium]|nr:hypothetical protein [Anaerolineales bacterium]